MKYLGSSHSMQMYDLSAPFMLKVTPLTKEEAACMLQAVRDGDIISAIGHQDTANVLGVPMNRISLHLNKGDILYVSQLTGGRLPEGSTTLPEGFKFTFIKVELV